VEDLLETALECSRLDVSAEDRRSYHSISKTTLQL
jgi:hypothetical protein